jgi:phenylpropionate dioxygenase-like ring-hydroxylating dioxygenase large terminal subunit
VKPAEGNPVGGLAADAYTSRKVFDWEMEHFFEEGWVFLGHGEDLSAPGDQKAFTIGKQSILVVRDRGGHLNAVYNTCRHRGHELLTPRSTRNIGAIKCPYHAWVYGLDGALRAAPLFGEVDGFDRSEYSLVPVELEEWSGSIFVNPSGVAPPLQDRIGNLGELVAPRAGDSMSSGATSEYEIEANWKTVTVNHLLGKDDHGERTGETYHYGVFPGQLLGFHPGYVSTYRIEPLGPGRTRVECRLFTAGARGPLPPRTGIRDDPQEFIATVARGYVVGRGPAD